MEKLLKSLPRVFLKLNNKIDFITALLDECQKIYGFARITFFPVADNLQYTFTKGLTKEKQKMVHSLTFTDKLTSS